MPKVGSYNTKIKGEYKCYEIWYDSKGKTFYLKDFPPEIISMVQNNRKEKGICGFSMEHNLIRYFNELLSEYHSLITKQKKVIIIEITLPSEVVRNKEGKNGYSGIQSWVKHSIEDKLNTFNFKGFGFSIEYRNYIKQEAKETKYFPVDEDGDISQHSYNFSRKEILEVDWTQEREDFLKMMNVRSNEMGRKIVEFFQQDEPALLASMERGSNLLLSAGDPDKQAIPKIRKTKARANDKVLFYGTGNNTKPTGIINRKEGKK